MYIHLYMYVVHVYTHVCTLTSWAEEMYVHVRIAQARGRNGREWVVCVFWVN